MCMKKKDIKKFKNWYLLSYFFNDFYTNTYCFLQSFILHQQKLKCILNKKEINIKVKSKIVNATCLTSVSANTS